MRRTNFTLISTQQQKTFSEGSAPAYLLGRSRVVFSLLMGQVIQCESRQIVNYVKDDGKVSSKSFLPFPTAKLFF